MTKELAKNIRRNVQDALLLCTPGNDEHSEMIDLLNHIDAIAQQIEGV